jgi:hypothetical protein
MKIKIKIPTALQYCIITSTFAAHHTNLLAIVKTEFAKHPVDKTSRRTKEANSFIVIGNLSAHQQQNNQR